MIEKAGRIGAAILAMPPGHADHPPALIVSVPSQITAGQTLQKTQAELVRSMLSQTIQIADETKTAGERAQENLRRTNEVSTCAPTDKKETSGVFSSSTNDSTGDTITQYKDGCEYFNHTLKSKGKIPPVIPPAPQVDTSQSVDQQTTTSEKQTNNSGEGSGIVVAAAIVIGVGIIGKLLFSSTSNGEDYSYASESNESSASDEQDQSSQDSDKPAPLEEAEQRRFPDWWYERKAGPSFAILPDPEETKSDFLKRAKRARNQRYAETHGEEIKEYERDYHKTRYDKDEKFREEAKERSRKNSREKRQDPEFRKKDNARRKKYPW